jgi:hypothetical protein
MAKTKVSADVRFVIPLGTILGLALKEHFSSSPVEVFHFHWPVKLATRFSTYAAIPSLASLLWNSADCNSRSSAK